MSYLEERRPLTSKQGCDYRPIYARFLQSTLQMLLRRFQGRTFQQCPFFFSEGSLSLGRIFPKNTLLGIGKNFLNLQVTLLRTQSP